MLPKNLSTKFAIFKNGHFYEDDRRIIPAEGKEYIIVGEESSFLSCDEMIIKPKVRSADAMQRFIHTKHGEANTILLLDAGTIFHFEFGLGIRRTGVELSKLKFEGRFEEDLYMYHIPNRKVADNKSWKVCECATSILECIDGSFELPEAIYADSPLKVFRSLINTHFNQQHCGSLSIYNNYIISKSLNKKFGRSTNGIVTLGNVRDFMLQQCIHFT